MAYGDDLVALARKHIGEEYFFGARARFLDPDFKGPWDCAEFISWVVFRVSGEQVLLGCMPRDPSRGDAYTGFWVDDARKYGLIISLGTALKTAGALLLRGPTKKRIGHIAFSLGNGRNTVEAYDRKHGVIRGQANPQSAGIYAVETAVASSLANAVGNGNRRRPKQIDYLGCSNAKLAGVLAARDLNLLSTPLGRR